MAKGFKHGAGGTNPLNFKVICNPKPETAKENTIWVDTDRINNYYFSDTKPENMEAYDVWFPVGTSSTVAFNALKKNGLQVYPISAKQYIGGSLVAKTAKSWRNGNWVEWVTYLYNTGNDCNDITGGWQAVNGRTDGYGNTGSCALKGDSFILSTSAPATSITRITKKKMDISKIKSIAIKVTAAMNSDANLFVSSTNNTTNSSMAANCGLAKTGIHYLDVSKVSGEYYVGVQLTNGVSDWTSREVAVSFIYME